MKGNRVCGSENMRVCWGLVGEVAREDRRKKGELRRGAGQRFLEGRKEILGVSHLS